MSIKSKEASYIIRKAKESEAKYLSDLAIRSKAYWGYDENFLEKCRPILTITKEYIQNWHVFVLEEKKVVKGFYTLKVIEGENRLDCLWLEQDNIGMGYGSILFHHIVFEAKKLGWSYFRLVGEPSAIGFYEKMGATKIGDIASSVGGGRLLPHMEYEIS